MADLPVNTNLDMLSASRVLHLPDAVDPQEPATLAQLNALVEGLAWKDDVRVASTGNVNISSPGASIDSVSLSSGDRVLLKDQSTASQNGLYNWNGASAAMTRTADGSTGAELTQAVVSVAEGSTSAGTTWRQSATIASIGSDTVTWVSFDPAIAAASETVAGKIEIATQSETDTGTDDARAVTPLKAKTASWMVRKYSTSIGDGSSTSFTVTHNLGSRDVIVMVRLSGSPYDVVLCEVEITDANTVTVKVNTAPASNAYRVTVLGA